MNNKKAKNLKRITKAYFIAKYKDKMTVRGFNKEFKKFYKMAKKRYIRGKEIDIEFLHRILPK